MLSKPKSLTSSAIINGEPHWILVILPELGGMRVNLGFNGCSGLIGFGGLGDTKS